MRTFDFYEFAGILAPGAVALASVLLIFPEIDARFTLSDFTAGDFGLFLILAYVAGHIVQSFGNIIERAWWSRWGGMPTDWVWSQRRSLLASAQLQSVEGKVRSKLALPSFTLGNLTRADYHGLTRQVYAVIAEEGRTERIDIFNGNYGLNRGIASALLVAAALTAIHSPSEWPLALIVLLGAAAAIQRMHRFGVLYGRELFVQLLVLD